MVISVFSTWIDNKIEEKPQPRVWNLVASGKYNAKTKNLFWVFITKSSMNCRRDEVPLSR